MAGLQGFKIFEFEEMPCAIVFDPVSLVLIAAPRPLGCETMEAVAASISAYRASLPPAQATKQNPRALSLMIAQECNLNCSYCFASQGTYGGPPKHMDLEVAKASVDFLLKGIGQGETASIILFGGEPLMNFEAIQVLVQHSERVAAAQGKFVAFSMTTNGTLLTEEALRFCREHKIALMVSVDGPPDIQDVQRPCRNPTESSSRLVEQNMAYIREYYGGRIPFPARVTVTPLNVHRLDEVVSYLGQLGFSRINVQPVALPQNVPGALGPADWKVFRDWLTVTAKRLVESVLSRRSLPPPHISNLLNTVGVLLRRSRRVKFCGGGSTYFSVDSAGTLYPCHRVVGSLGELGEVARGPIPKLVPARFATVVGDHSGCGKCWARYVCGGGCSAIWYLCGPLVFARWCAWIKHCLREAIRVTAALALSLEDH